MKRLLLAFAMLAIFTPQADAGLFFRGRAGIFARATFAPQPRISRTKMVWRGDWVPVSELRK